MQLTDINCFILYVLERVYLRYVRPKEVSKLIASQPEGITQPISLEPPTANSGRKFKSRADDFQKPSNPPHFKHHISPKTIRRETFA